MWTHHLLETFYGGTGSGVDRLLSDGSGIWAAPSQTDQIACVSGLLPRLRHP
jgi:hypothetical protein